MLCQPKTPSVECVPYPISIGIFSLVVPNRWYHWSLNLIILLLSLLRFIHQLHCRTKGLSITPFLQSSQIPRPSPMKIATITFLTMVRWDSSGYTPSISSSYSSFIITSILDSSAAADLSCQLILSSQKQRHFTDNNCHIIIYRRPKQQHLID